MLTKVTTELKFVRFYIPSRQRDGSAVTLHNHGVCTRAVEAALAEMFGGFTAHTALGGWKDGEKIVTESVTVYESGVTRALENKEVNTIMGLGEGILRSLNQSEVRIEVCGSVYTLSMP